MLLPKQLKSTVTDHEQLSVSLIREGLYDYGRSRFTQSQQFFQKAALIRPEAKSIRFNLAVALEAGDKFEESLEVFLGLIEADPLNLSYIEGAARSYYRLRQYESAEEYFARALLIAESAQDARSVARNARSISVLKFSLGLESQALCYSELAFTRFTKNEELYRHIQLLSALHQYDQAISLLTKYEKQRGLIEDPVFMPWYALLFFEKGDFLSSARIASDYLKRYAASREENLMKALLFLSRSNLNKIVEEEEFNSLLAEMEDQWMELRSSLRKNESMIYWPQSFLEQLARL
jgi:tetratricopeptide (TPR) repeat protein